MSLSRRAALALPLLATLPRPSPARADAETYPTKAIRIIVPFAPGGSGDITSRLIGKYIEDKTGQPFVVENKPGANGIVGVMAVKAAPADGYTLMLATTSTNAANVHMYKNPGYDPEKDFQVVGVIGASGAFLVVPADSPYKSLADLVATAKAKPGKLNFGYFNASSQVPAEVLGKKAGVDWQGVGYKAIGNAWNDLYGGTSSSCSSTSRRRRGQVVAREGAAARHLAAAAQPALSRRAGAGRDLSRLRHAPASSPSPCPRRRRGRSRRGSNTLINEALTSPEIHKRLTDEFALDSARARASSNAPRRIARSAPSGPST